jgi:hypothetical protein
MRENQLARDIVANLAWRYRVARALARNSVATPEAQLIRDVGEIEAWNAYVASQRILYGQEGT